MNVWAWWPLLLCAGALCVIIIVAAIEGQKHN